MACTESKVRSTAVASGITTAEMLGPRETVRCVCGHNLFDGIVVRSRIVRLLPRGGADALCRCKRWVPVPLTYSGS